MCSGIPVESISSGPQNGRQVTLRRICLGIAEETAYYHQTKVEELDILHGATAGKSDLQH